MRPFLGGLFVLGVMIAAGCGVQSGHKTATPDCGAINTMTDIKVSMDTLDHKIQDNRPSPVTRESLRRLAPFYSDAASTFDGLLERANGGLTAARSAGRPADLTGLWSLMAESLKLRRDGMQFYARTFAQPENMSRSQLAQGQTYLHKTERLNSRLQSSMISLLTSRGSRRAPTVNS